MAAFTRKTGVDAATLLQADDGASGTAKAPSSAVRSGARRCGHVRPSHRYQWVGGADGDLFQVEDTRNQASRAAPN